MQSFVEQPKFSSVRIYDIQFLFKISLVKETHKEMT